MANKILFTSKEQRIIDEINENFNKSKFKFDKSITLTEPNEKLIEDFKNGVFDDYEQWFRQGYVLFKLCATKNVWEAITTDEERKKKINIFWNKFKSINLDQEEYVRRINEWALNQSHQLFSHLNKIRIGGKQMVMDMSLTSDENNIEYDLIDYYNAEKHFTEDKYLVDYMEKVGDKTKEVKKNAFKLWFNNPPVSFVGLKFDAELPFGAVKMNNSYIYNDYHSPVLQDGDGDYEMFFEHIKHNICRDNNETYEFVKKWIFHLLKYPNSKNGVCLAFRGKQGTGKSSVYDILSMFFDERFSTTVNEAEQLTNRFNAKYASSYLLSLEEAVFAGTKKTGVWSKMKDMLTNPKITLERKGLDAFDIDNHLHIMITTNSDWVAPKEEGDRRYLVLNVSDERKEDWEYFKEMKRQMREGGCKKLYEYAVNESGITRDDEDWRIPYTDAGVEDMLNTVSPVKRALVRLYEEYREEPELVADVFEKTTKGFLFIRPSNMYNIYNKIGVGVDRGRKEVSRILDTKKTKAVIEKGGSSITGYLFNDIEDFRNAIVQYGFDGVDVFKVIMKDCNVEDDNEVVLDSIENLLKENTDMILYKAKHKII